MGDEYNANGQPNLDFMNPELNRDMDHYLGRNNELLDQTYRGNTGGYGYGYGTYQQCVIPQRIIPGWGGSVVVVPPRIVPCITNNQNHEFESPGTTPRSEFPRIPPRGRY
ncbi:MAG: hypothetical protein U1E36_07735 [Rickettsiales bacterium]